jgi:hypothetical protein
VLVASGGAEESGLGHLGAVAVEAPSPNRGGMSGPNVGSGGGLEAPSWRRWAAPGGLVWRRGGLRRFIIPLMFLICHIIDEHKRTAPRVPSLLMFVGSTIRWQCQVRYQPVICSLETCQTDERKVSSLVLKMMNTTKISI